MELLRGDCLELMKDLPDKSIDMILCDLPYGLTQAEWDTPIDLPALFTEYNRIIKDHGAICLFAIQPFETDLINANRKYYRYEWIWNKRRPTGFLNANRMPLRIHENIVVFYKKLPTYNPQKFMKKPYRRSPQSKFTALYGAFTLQESRSETGERYPIDIIDFPNGRHARHQTEKPLSILEYLIKTYTNPGDVVLDSCMGSGSTGVACVNTGRDFIGMEINDHYYCLAVNRIIETQEAKAASF